MRWRDRIADRQRRRTVTDEPYEIGADVKGLPLATIGRRAAAISIDSVLVAILGSPLLVLLTWGALYVQSPAAFQLLSAPVLGQWPEDADNAAAELLQIVWRHRPGAVPEALAPPLAAGDLDEVARLLGEAPISIFADLSNGAQSFFDPSSRRLQVGQDALVGRSSSFIGVGAIALVFFTVTTWLGGGRSPGKWLLGIRVVRLDGTPLSIWNAFGRAGGYAASASMLGLGFLEAAWDPNRQAAHDCVAATVVVREGRRRQSR